MRIKTLKTCSKDQIYRELVHHEDDTFVLVSSIGDWGFQRISQNALKRPQSPCYVRCCWRLFMGVAFLGVA